MAKRANPFTEDFIPQSKVYVGVKQFNNNNERLKTVYEKTLALLFKGARKTPTSDALNNNDINFTKKDDKMKQLFIGKDGSLIHTGEVVQCNTAVICCVGCGSPVESRCAYCEAVLCGGCQQTCHLCHNTYCSHCVISGSECLEVCLSCYG